MKIGRVNFLRNKEAIKYLVSWNNWDINDYIDRFKIIVFLSFIKYQIRVDSPLYKAINSYLSNISASKLFNKLSQLKKEENLPYLLKKYIRGEMELYTLQLSTTKGKTLKKKVNWRDIKELLKWMPNKLIYEWKVPTE